MVAAIEGGGARGTCGRDSGDREPVTAAAAPAEEEEVNLVATTAAGDTEATGRVDGRCHGGRHGMSTVVAGDGRHKSGGGHGGGGVGVAIVACGAFAVVGLGFRKQFKMKTDTKINLRALQLFCAMVFLKANLSET